MPRVPTRLVNGLLRVAVKRRLERVVIGAPLPDPLVFGKLIDRGSTVSGILIHDADGNERGGYVTDDDTGAAFLTLDEVGRMAAIFSADPVGGVRLRMNDIRGDAVVLGANVEDGPYLQMVRRGETVFRQPPREAP